MTALKVPPLGESIVEATVSRWLKQEGDPLNAGDTVVELDTDKITVEVPAIRAGVLAKQAAKDGDIVHVDDVLGEIDESAATSAQVQQSPVIPAKAGIHVPADGKLDSRVRGNDEPGAAPVSSPQSPPRSSPAKSSPVARRVAEERGIDISQLQGTGRGGVVSKPDVMAAPASPAVPAAPSSPAPPLTPAVPLNPQPSTLNPPATPTATRETREKLSTRRKRIAENLLQSHLATAHLTTFNEIDMSAVSALRERVKEKVEKQYGVRLSFMPFFVRAACIALREFPTVDAQLEGDEIVLKHYVNVGIAVASDQGLVVPNIKDADSKGLIEIARDIVALAKKARETKLTMDDLTGGSFTITNGGVFGSLISTPIINYPQVAILGLHKIQERPVAIEGKVEIRPMMYVALSYDHRIVEGEIAVRFLVRVKELMEDPAAMLLE